MSAADPDNSGAISFVWTNPGFHAMNPQAAVYWNPLNTLKDTYTLKATFTLEQPSPHINYYGLILGASDLEGPQQRYVYFLVAQNGTWLLKRRVGDSKVETLSPSTPSDAVRKPDATGKSTNILEVHVLKEKIEYIVNGHVVTTSSRSDSTINTDGIYGFRINHLLEVQVDDFDGRMFGEVHAKNLANPYQLWRPLGW